MAEESSSAPITPLKYKQTQGSYVLAKPFRSPLKRPVRSYDLQSTPDASSFVCQYSAESSPSSVQIGDFGRDSEDSMVIKSSKFREKFLSIANNGSLVSALQPFFSAYPVFMIPLLIK